ncbi:GNAT family N-acetyltransferase [Deinococcus peraridilitoris]|uniref:Acetyltransferase, ribosomal protein N-acetylase n=1 Tax=Deinococcus peraridilitoris (strain DSM 19664 / LMG 22246 / CIP 109416 / KR-200) TaxID=937777 RepID=L0A2M8_DEIPD|nr:GNAT family protein [Deinococcus peraridilitoris]AFZ67270.1 acetyltransferase, ribosomal protein N-acetylase [Deinococcus peraridilitoris DSM 19664]
MTSDPWQDRPTLRGQFVTLEPLGTQHAAALARQHDPEVFRYLGRGGPADDTPQAWQEFIVYLNAIPGRWNFAILVHGTPDVAGRISYSEMRRADRGLEIGTMIMPAYQGTFVNPESKLLLLQYGFEVLNAARVQFKVDALNERSQRAMEKLGAVREGVLRQYQVRPDGSMRDSVMYSVTGNEWPEVRSRLRERLQRAGTLNTP